MVRKRSPPIVLACRRDRTAIADTMADVEEEKLHMVTETTESVK
jgi:hypothetical protein